MFSSTSFAFKKILAEFNIHTDIEFPAQERQLVNDSRQIKAGDIFCAVNGTVKAGSEFIPHALAANCHAILVECDTAERHGKQRTLLNKNNESVAVIDFFALNEQLFSLAQKFYQSPQDKLNIIGITGTNGKTSTSQLLAQLLDACGQQCSVIGTNGVGKVDALAPINNTTPGATEFHQILQEFVESSQSHVAVEVSSHALEQNRVKSSLFNTAIFTNLSRDHLDYHKTMENYANAKLKLFSHHENSHIRNEQNHTSISQQAIINGDDPTGKAWLKSWPNQHDVIVYGRGESVTGYRQFVQARRIKHLSVGVEFELNTHLGRVDITSRLLGDFNIDNLLAAIAVLCGTNHKQSFSLNEISRGVEKLLPIAGRMEVFEQANMPIAIVDYAHTPDGLKNALLACRQHCDGAIWVVFGCGGDRDKGKRSLMGQEAERNSDHIVITNDNPRTENAENIAKDILAGCKHPEKIAVMLERQQAVISTLKKAKQNDVVLLAGKGHEDYIIMGNQRTYYNEREFVRSIYAHGATS